MRNEVRSMPWAVKLLLTLLVGSLFPIGAFFIPPDEIPIVVPEEGLGLAW